MDNNDNKVLIKDKQGHLRLVKVALGSEADALKMAAVELPSITPSISPLSRGRDDERAPLLPQGRDNEEIPSLSRGKDNERISTLESGRESGSQPGTAKSDFYFDVQDEEDVKMYKDKELEGLGSEKKNIVSALALEIVNELAFNLNESATKRLTSIIVSNLIGVRDNLETRQALTKPLLRGGLGLSEEQTENAIQLIVKAKPEIEQRLQNYRKNKEAALKLKKEQALPIRAPAPAIIEPAMAMKTAEAAAKPLGEVHVSTTGKEKLKLADVQPVYRLISPIDELRAIDLNVFHRLSDGIDGRCQKIRQKIDLLGDEGLPKMLEGINGFKASPLYQLYLKMGAECFKRKISVEQVADIFKNQNEAYLTRDEFEAIADLSREFSF